MKRSTVGSIVIMILTAVLCITVGVDSALAQSSVGSPAVIKKPQAAVVESKAVTTPIVPAKANAPVAPATVYVPFPVETITIIDVRTGNRYNLYLTDPGIRYFIDRVNGASHIEMNVDSARVVPADAPVDIQVHVNSNKMFQDAMERRAGSGQ